MKRLLSLGLLCSLVQGIATKPLVVKDAIDLRSRVLGSPNAELMSGKHNAHNTVGEHKRQLQDEIAILNGDHKLYTTNPISKVDVYHNNAGKIHLPDPPSPSSLFEKYRVEDWSRRTIDVRTPRHSSKIKPHDDLYFSADTNLATDIVLDGNLIQKDAQVIQSNMINELKSFIPNSKLQDEDKLQKVKENIERFAKIKDITKWEEVSREDPESAKSWVTNIIISMQQELKLGYNSGVMTFDLQVMKCLGYVNVHAKDYFLEHIFESLSDEEVDRMWRALIESEAEFRTESLWRGILYSDSEAESEMGDNPSVYPGRYNNFLEQLHFEWTELNERSGHLQAFQKAIDKEEVPKALESDILELKDVFSRLKMRTSWPVIDKGYYEDILSVINKIQDVLRQPVTRDIKGAQAVQLAYQALNHIYRFDLQTKITSKWLINTLEDSDVQQSLYLHVLTKEGLSHRDVIGMKLLKDFNLKARLNTMEQESLAKEWESKCYSVVSQAIVRKKEIPQIQYGDIKRSLPASFQSDETFERMLNCVAKLTQGDLQANSKPPGALETKSQKTDKVTRPSEKSLKGIPQRNLKASEEIVSKEVHSVLRNLEKLSRKESTSKILSPEEKASVQILNSLVSQNHFAWHLTRSEIGVYPMKSMSESLGSRIEDVSAKTLLEYLKLLRSKAGNAQSGDERVSLEKQLDFVSGMTDEIEEYDRRRIDTMSLNLILKAKHRQSSNKAGDLTPLFLQQYLNFMERLSQFWFETRWKRVETGDHASIVDLAKESFVLIQSQAFAHLPKGLDTEFVGVLRYLARQDPTGFFRRFYDNAISDITDYSTYQFIAKSIAPKERYFVRRGDWCWY